MTDETDLALIDHRVESLQREKDRASAMRIRGAKLLALLPVNFIAVLISLLLFGGNAIVAILFVVACLYAVIGGVGGIVMVAVGTAQKRVAGERMTELMLSRGLPEARVVVR